MAFNVGAAPVGILARALTGNIFVEKSLAYMNEGDKDGYNAYKHDIKNVLRARSANPASTVANTSKKQAYKRSLVVVESFETFDPADYYAHWKDYQPAGEFQWEGLPAEVQATLEELMLGTSAEATENELTNGDGTLVTGLIPQLESNAYTPLSSGAVKALATFTTTSAIATDAITINGLVYTGVAGAKADNTEFSIDTSDAATAVDLADSIQNDARLGVTVPSLDVTAEVLAAGVVTVSASVGGVLGNSIDTTSADATIVASSATLLTGAEAASVAATPTQVVDNTAIAFRAHGGGDGDALSVNLTSSNIFAKLDILIANQSEAMRKRPNRKFMVNHATGDLVREAQRNAQFKGVDFTEEGAMRYGGFDIIENPSFPSGAILLASMSGDFKTDAIQLGTSLSADFNNLEVNRLSNFGREWGMLLTFALDIFLVRPEECCFYTQSTIV